MENSRNYFFWYRPHYEEAIQKIVCSGCQRWKGGECQTPDPKGCALFRVLPQLVMIAQCLDRPTPESYTAAVRENVVLKCHNPDPAQPCPYRDTLECGLEEYLPWVLQAVEQVEKSLEGGEIHEISTI